MKKEVKEILPSVGEYSHSSEDYIRSLEMAVQLYQREVENLRSQLKNVKNKEKPNGADNIIFDYELIKSKLNICKTEKCVFDIIAENINPYISMLESSLFLISSESKLVEINEIEVSENFNQNIKKLEEDGIIDWAIEKMTPSVIPNTGEEYENVQTYIFALPLYNRGLPIGIFISKVSNSTIDEEEQYLTIIEGLAEISATALDNIISSKEIAKMNQKLSVLNMQMLQASKFASIGELAASISAEIESPLHIIHGNLKLLQSGVGESERRFEIIFEQIKKIAEINMRLAKFSESSKAERNPTPIFISNLIDEVILLSGSQLQRDGIKIEKEYENLDYQILGSYNEIEQVILNLLFFSRDNMLDGGLINIGVFKVKNNKLLISISDNGNGISEEEQNQLFSQTSDTESENRRLRVGLFLLKDIIKQHRGDISVFSEIGKGTTIKINFPLFLQR